MNETEALSRLRQRAVTMRLAGKGIDKVIDSSKGPVGVFLPPVQHRKEAIVQLRTGRSDGKTLMTLCHELGHFWSYATGRRTASYERALRKFGSWESILDSKIHNHDAVMALALKPGSPIPNDVYATALADSKREKPNPLANDERKDIVAEEVRAWCFGFAVAKELHLDADLIVGEANTALHYYFERLELPSVSWEPTSCTDSFSNEDRRYIEGLTA